MRVLESKIVEIDPTTGSMLMYQKIVGASDEETDLPTNLCTGSEFLRLIQEKTCILKKQILNGLTLLKKVVANYG